MTLAVKKVVACVSGKGGTGKSLLAANIAYALEHRGQEVGILDCDIRSPNITCILGIGDNIELEQATDGRSIVRRLWGDIFIMSSGLLARNYRAATPTGDQVSAFLNQAVNNFIWPKDLDCLVLDMDPSAGDSMKAIHQMFRGKLEFVIISSSDVSSLSDCQRMIQACQNKKIPIVGIVANMVGSECPVCSHTIICDDCGQVISFGDEEKVKRLADAKVIPYLGAIQFNPAIKERTDHGDPILPNNAVIKTILEKINDSETSPC